MPASVLSLSTYQTLIVNALKAHGYADSAACALAERFANTIRTGHELNLSATEVAAEISRIDDEESDTPTVVMTAGEMREAALVAVEAVMEEGR